MKIFSWFWLGLAISLHAGTTQALSKVDLQLLYRNRFGGGNAAKQLNDQLVSKEAAMIHLRSILAGKISPASGEAIDAGHARTLLWNLGDRECLEAIYQRYRDAPRQWSRIQRFVFDFPQIVHPAFVEILATDLDREPADIRIFADTLEAFEIPYANAKEILWIVAESGFFPVGVSKWAKDVGSTRGWHQPETYLDDVRAFWALNRREIEAREYHRVRPPGAAFATAVNEPPAAKTPEPEKAPNPKLAPAKAERAPIAPTQPTPAPEPWGLVWFWALGGVGLALALWLLLKPKH